MFLPTDLHRSNRHPLHSEHGPEQKCPWVLRESLPSLSREDTRALPLLGVYQSAAGIRGQRCSVRDSLVDYWRLHTYRAGYLNTVIIGMQDMISQ